MASGRPSLAGDVLASMTSYDTVAMSVITSM
jgi:hypothetical protein